MSTCTVSARPVKTMVFGFVGFGIAAAALAAAEKFGALGPDTVRRGLGLLIGVIVVVTGNFLPKARPLNAPGVNPEQAAAAAERLAGWILVLVGLAYIGLFAFAPLERARTVASILGISAMILIAANWTWLVRGAVLGGNVDPEESAADRARAAAKRRLIVPLLFAFFYVFAIACTVFLLRDRHVIDEVSWWMFLGFWLIYSVLMAVLAPKRSSRL